ncbi:uncharacterized protein RCH25_043031 [Pelodytes ibericus]
MPSNLLSPFPELDTNFSKKCPSLGEDVTLMLSPCREQNRTVSCPSNLNQNIGSYEELAECPVWPLENRSTEIPTSNILQHIPFQAERSVSMIEDGWKSPGSTKAHASRYKTELCRTFHYSGFCKYGTKCQFAHGARELRGLTRHPKYKTELCRTYHTIGFCPYGSRCAFIHNAEDQSTCHYNYPLRQSLSCSEIPSSSSSSPLSSSPFSPSSTSSSSFSSFNPFCSSVPSFSLTASLSQAMVSEGIILHLSPSPTMDPGGCDSSSEDEEGTNMDYDFTLDCFQEIKRLPIFSQLSD